MNWEKDYLEKALNKQISYLKDLPSKRGTMILNDAEKDRDLERFRNLREKLMDQDLEKMQLLFLRLIEQ